MNVLFERKKILFVLIFAVLTVLAYRVNFSFLLGTENQSFTLFQFFAPTAAAFLGPVAGIAGIFLAQAANFALLGRGFSLFETARLFPMLFAAYYFGSKSKKSAVVPLACMALFVFHPVGRQAWFYSLYWLVPVAGIFFRKNLFIRSLGSTFSAHAVGSVAFLYLLPSSPQLWIALIPVVFVERALFASGISLSFIAFNTALAKLGARIPSGLLRLEKRYAVA